MKAVNYKPGDAIIFVKQKYSLRPGPRARSVRANPNGEGYSYLVDKYWRVDGLEDNGSLVLTTRRGKRHVIATTDDRLRKPNWLERLFLRKAFPAIEA
ncbi:MAG: hypothetical protein GKR94_00725 [Gammaproteobacteria bacterium]|nr:hypothetical protein [Gammaproteobacteria bacterium]